jgi:hypothetical protein
MKARPTQAPPVGSGSVSAGEILTLREAGRRLGLGTRCLCDLQRAGLRTITLGRRKFVVGSDLIFFATQQAGAQGKGGGDE